MIEKREIKNVPDPLNFFAATIGRNGWRRIGRGTDIRPGDIIARRVEKRIKGKSTGHVQIVIGPPKRTEDGNLRVPIVESSSIGNLWKDSNEKKGSTKPSVHTGEILLVLNSKGNVIDRCGKEGRNKNRQRPITIGRPVSLKK